jgi:hypothetical protein
VATQLFYYRATAIVALHLVHTADVISAHDHVTKDGYGACTVLLPPSLMSFLLK